MNLQIYNKLKFDKKLDHQKKQLNYLKKTLISSNEIHDFCKKKFNSKFLNIN